MNKELLPHEINHINELRKVAGECALFLKKDNSFPLKEVTNVTLIGNGVRHTVIGGTGSGAVNTRYKPTIEEAFINAGFKIDSNSWLDQYDEIRENCEKDFVKEIKKEAKKHKTMAPNYALGKEILEPEYNFAINGDKKVAIYILSRNGGENSDRRLEKGDVYLSDTEVRDIHYLNDNYEKFLLVLNTPNIIDLEKIKDVKNILLLSQLGSVTSDVLVDIVLGKINPSGKLTDTYAYIKDYPYISTPISEDETNYLEGSYVGYRYFSSKDIKPIFPFGFGLSYTEFISQLLEYKVEGDNVSLKVKVTNVGPLSGKEVIQVYISAPSPRPKLELVAFKKSSEIKEKESEILELNFSLSEFPLYSVEEEAYMLNKGNYHVYFGNSSDSLKEVVVLSLSKSVILKQVRNVFDKPDFSDLVIDREEAKIESGVKIVKIDPYIFSTESIDYMVKNIEIPEYISSLKDDELILLCLGDYKTGVNGLIGQSCSLVNGGAGETTLRIPSLEYAINMVDGPAGLRLTEEYIVNDKCEFPITGDSIWYTLEKYLPAPLPYLLSYERNKNKKGSHVIQGATAIPIATALAQSFSSMVQSTCGRLVKEEMEIYNVDVWLAPGINIHRHLLCGRNFEYFSEDPLVSAFSASNIINAVQENPHKAVTIKHFACNNLETNRINNNSIVSEKAIREIYLPAFYKAIKWSNPKSIMTAYNLIDGIHASEHRGLILDILRTEWGYDGLIMTDWIKSGQVYKKGNVYPAAYASRNLKNGNNICMPGSKADIKDIKKAHKEGYLSRSELENAATIVYNFILTLKKE